MRNKRSNQNLYTEDIIDTNPWEGGFHREENRIRHWEGVTVSHRRRNSVSYKEQDYTTNTNLNDTGVNRKRNKKENIRTWERETSTNKANICPWGDP